MLGRWRSDIQEHRRRETFRRAAKKAAVYYENGGPEVLKYEDVADPVCNPGGVLADTMTERFHTNLQRLIDEAARGDLELLIDRTFPLSEAAAAHAYIESRQAVGRMLLTP